MLFSDTLYFKASPNIDSPLLILCFNIFWEKTLPLQNKAISIKILTNFMGTYLCRKNNTVLFKEAQFTNKMPFTDDFNFLLMGRIQFKLI